MEDDEYYDEEDDPQAEAEEYEIQKQQALKSTNMDRVNEWLLRIQPRVL